MFTVKATVVVLLNLGSPLLSSILPTRRGGANENREPLFVLFSFYAFHFMTINTVLNHHSVLVLQKSHQGAQSVDGEKMTRRRWQPSPAALLCGRK